jgi:hypothetical protein
MSTIAVEGTQPQTEDWVLPDEVEEQECGTEDRIVDSTSDSEPADHEVGTNVGPIRGERDAGRLTRAAKKIAYDFSRE